METSPLYMGMGAKGQSKYSTIRAGDRFGSWTVIGEVHMDGYAKVSCECECGDQYVVDCYTLVAGKSSSCKPCGLPRKTSSNPSWRGYKEVPQSWFSGFQRRAKKGFEILIEDVWALYVKQDRKCALSGLPIDFKNQSSKKGLRSYTASLDRIDSAKGYTKDNIQLVHKDVNIMKNAYDQQHFLNICKLIAEHNK